jgi:hypothetical protein
MPLDPVLAQGITPINFAGPDPATKMNQLAMMMKMQGLQQEGQLNSLKLTEAQRQADEVNAIKTAIARGEDFHDPNIAARHGTSGLAFHRALRESDNAELENKTKKVTYARNLWAGAYNQESYDNLLPQLEQLIPGSTASLPRVFDPKIVAENVRDADSILDRYKPTDFGRTLIAAGYAEGSPEYTRLMQRKVDLDSTRAPTEAGQLPADVRTAQWYQNATEEQKQAFDAMRQGGVADPKKVAQTATDNAGKMRFFNAYGVEITPTSGAGAPTTVQGKPSATFEKAANLRKQMSLDLDGAITELTEISKDGGLIDQSTGSGLGQLADTAVGVIGQATPGAIAISKLQPIADLVLKMVPRFEGPQSDKDTQSYKEAAGQLANGNLPNAIRKAAAREIVRLMTKRKGQFVSLAMADEGLAAQEENGAAPELPAANKDADAIEWAKSNPSDPRAAQILKLNGM